MRTRIVLGLLVTLFVSTPAIAATILFQDNFDNVAGSSGGTAASPTIGTWTGGGVIAVDSGTDAGFPPVSSPNHATMNAPGGGTITFAAAANNTDILRAEFDYWPDGVAVGEGTGIDFPDTFLQFRGDGQIYMDGPFAAFTLPTNNWSHITLDYDPVAASLKLTAGANTQTIPATGGAALAGIGYYTFGGGFGRFDNVQVTLLNVVPEPSSLGLLTSAMLGLAGYARRKRA